MIENATKERLGSISKKFRITGSLTLRIKAVGRSITCTQIRVHAPMAATLESKKKSDTHGYKASLA